MEAAPLVRAGLAAFVVAWIFDVLGLRTALPLWLPFVIALALELQFFAGAWRATARRRPDHAPQDVDVDHQADDFLLVRRGGEEWWIPYAGESPEEVEEMIAEALEEEPDEEDDFEPVELDRRRPLRRLLVGLGVIAALAAVAWFVDSRSGWNGVDDDARAEATARFSAEASRIAGHPVTIRCDVSGSFVGAVQHSDGVAEIGGRIAYLTPERCFDLYRLAFEDETSFSQAAHSIAVLAHEAWHLRGVRNEGTTECYALQSGVELGQRLGLSERTARQMMRQQLAENALRGGTTAEYRIPPECRDGGSLDLHPDSSSFP
jgi:hypothetical protein